MRAVARGERRAPPGANVASFNSLEALARILTPENRVLMRVIRDERPQSIAELARKVDRAESNLSRTLEKLASAGLLVLKRVDNRRVPEVVVRELQVTIDPFGERDRIDVASA
ncbi:helix-turn-helix domain-containing protein [Enterovirga aerilata]|uniref:Helix-turn-helix domain-containing protein n=1 Tax=Enterovirga aerilata TaxID=2730920 RepID=A0A849I0Z3_9HYPH|nr:helix-turn-helix domain-containing protein [Enterovirga sp. DB1703]NNM73436.1 helix-turn-helix domain-containing protein [Enterovirga sp. DB1703]